jgi:uncharacterized membrane-anchored protein
MTFALTANLLLAALVIFMVVAPLVWAIRTSPRDERRLAARRRHHRRHGAVAWRNPYSRGAASSEAS